MLHLFTLDIQFHLEMCQIANKMGWDAVSSWFNNNNFNYLLLLLFIVVAVLVNNNNNNKCYF